MSPSVAIVGAGMGGLAAAVALSGRSTWDVTVLEAASQPGGKVSVAGHDGVHFDTGPSMLSLVSILEALLESRGRSLESMLTLHRPVPVMRYHFGTGETLEVGAQRQQTRNEVERVLGKEAGREFDEFIQYAHKIWEVAAPHFVLGPAPKAITALKLGVSAMRDLMAIDASRTMMAALNSRVDDQRLRSLFMRYATFNGSDPRGAPATMHCISWVDQGLGGWSVEGGMFELVRVLERVAREGGVQMHYNRPVRSIRQRTRGFEVQWEGGRRTVDAVIVNTCARQLVERLWDGDVDLGIGTEGRPSMSAWTAVIQARRRSNRAAHTLLFPQREYVQEFVDIFDRCIPPTDPAIYLCAREKAHCASGWADAEPVFVMTNAPAVSEVDVEVDWEEHQEQVMHRLRDQDLIDEDDEVVWRRTPGDLAKRFPCSRGSLYGRASNSRLAAFRRPPNRAPGVEGLYLAGGSFHPGGGVPLCIQSGRQAAKELLDELG